MRKKKEILFLRGFPGSGKSTWANEKKASSVEPSACIVLSTDAFFVNERGSYEWSAQALAKAHAWNQERFRLALEHVDHLDMLILDNCNLNREDVAPYVALLRAHSDSFLTSIVDFPQVEHLEPREMIKRSKHCSHMSMVEIDRMVNRRKVEDWRIDDTKCVAAQVKDCAEVTKFRRRVRNFLTSAMNGRDLKEVLSMSAYEIAEERRVSSSSTSNSTASSSLLVQVILNNGRKERALPVLIKRPIDFKSLKKSCCTKLKAKGSSKCRIFNLAGYEIFTGSDLSFCSGVESGRGDESPVLIVSPTGKDFLPVDLKLRGDRKKEEIVKSRQVALQTRNSLPKSFLRLPLGMTLITEIGEQRIFIGSGRDSMDKDQLVQRNKVTDIVCVASDWLHRLPVDSNCSFKYHDFKGCLDDSSILKSDSSLVLDIFSDFFTLMDSILAENRSARILVHCFVGKSRSPAFLAAYLVYSGLAGSLKSAMQMISARDLSINFYNHFLPFLIELEMQLTRSSSVGWESAVSSSVRLDDHHRHRQRLSTVHKWLKMNALSARSRASATHLWRWSGTAQHEDDEYFEVSSLKRDALCGAIAVALAQGEAVNLYAKSGEHFAATAVGAHITIDHITDEDRNVISRTSSIVMLPDHQHRLIHQLYLTLRGESHPCSRASLYANSSSELGTAIIGKRKQKSIAAANALLTFLKENGLEKTKKKLSLKVSRHETHRHLISLSYTNNHFESDAALAARGAVVDLKRMKFVALPFTKFFNFKDTRAASLREDEPLVISEKVDGSLSCLYFYESQWHVASQRSADGNGVLGSNGDTFSELFWRIWKQRNYPTLPVSSVDEVTRYCFVFELFSKSLPVVIEPPEDMLLLTGAREMDSLREINVREAAQLLSEEVLVVKHFQDIASVSEALELVDSRDSTLHEGFILRDSSFNRVKLKSKEYVATALGNGNLDPRTGNGMADFELHCRRVVDGVCRKQEGEEMLLYARSEAERKAINEVMLRYEKNKDQITANHSDQYILTLLGLD